MSKFIHSYLRTTELVLNYYHGQEPFPDFLKRYFKQQPKFGSRDRRTITDLCFSYMRVGRAMQTDIISTQILVGYFLTHDKDNGIVAALKPEWTEKLSEHLSKKLAHISPAFPSFIQQEIFPFKSSLSSGLCKDDLINSCFIQSHVFLRVRPGKEAFVNQYLSDAKIEFRALSENSYALPVGVKLDQVVKINKDVVIQDLSSQQTAEFLPSIKNNQPIIWDACAASGGKSIMMKDHYKKLVLYVSDLRDSVLQQLKLRLDAAGVKADKIFKADMTERVHHTLSKTFPKDGFDLILADVPCSGSGTWGRNPEWLRVFTDDDLDKFQDRQMKIVRNLIPFVKKDGYLLYITCSVFKKENEEIVDYILSNSGLKLVRSESISNVEQGGDFLYAALFISES